MQKGFLSALKKILADRRRRRMWQRLVSGMMAMVVFCTTYSLILPGITLERQVYCGLEEHTHTDECYGKGDGESKVLVCTPESEAEFVIHTHDDMCYDENGNLICQLEELEEHEHSDDCYSVTTELTCDKEESEGHTHTDECYEQTLGDLTCDNASSEHTHDDSCYEQIEELVCGQEETEGHTHTDECYTEVNELVCDLPEVVEHKHSSDCNENGVLACGKPEVIKHQHTEDCFDVQSEDDKVLTCGMEEHTHTEDCYQKPDENSGSGGGGGAVANTETTTESATEVTTATESTTEGTTEEQNDLVFSYSDEYVSGVISLPWSKELPNDLDCDVVTITEGDENYTDMRASVGDKVGGAGRDIFNVLLYKLEWKTGEDEIYVLPEDINPTIQFTVLDVGSDTHVEGVVLSEKDTEDENDEAELDIMVDKFSVDTVSDIFDVDNWENIEVPDYNSNYNEDVEYTNVEESPGEPIGDFNQEESLNGNSTAYEAEVVATDSDDGSVSTELSETCVFAFALVSEVDYGTGGYYKKITNPDDLLYSNRYLIVAQNGLLALDIEQYSIGDKKTFYTGHTYKDDSGNEVEYSFEKYALDYGSRPVEIQRVPTSSDPDVNNATEYYRIVDPNDGDAPVVPDSENYKTCFAKIHNWSDYGYYMIYSANNTNYALGFLSSSKWMLYHYAYIFTASSLGRGSKETWFIRGGMRDTTNDSVTGESGDEKYIYTYIYSDGNQISQNMYTDNKNDLCESQFLIYQYVGDVTTESDITAVKNIDDDSAVNYVMPKPVCEQFSDISGAKTIDATFDSTHTFDGAEVTAKSDPASSLIEDELCIDSSQDDLDSLYMKQKKNDGRIVTDKSVIYGDDDYGAISSSDYKTGDFSVALSALGQEWNVSDSVEDVAPIDVVLIYDISKSMTEKINYEAGTTKVKWEESADAINAIMKEIYAANPENRVGIVLFSDTSADVLPLGRYSSDDGDILTYTAGDNTTLRLSDTLYDGYTTDANRSESTYRGNKLSIRGTWGATDTQNGLQQAYELFRKKNDTYVYYQEYNQTIKRQPVEILLTDGDPTYCTYNYMNPKVGPVYGRGCSVGIEGYYTILSANYFKNLTSIFYNKKAYFYTIGMGIKPSGYGTYNQDAGYTQTSRYPDNAYMRAVLNPTEENVENLSNYSVDGWKKLYESTGKKVYLNEINYAQQFWEMTSVQLKELLTCKDENGNDVDPGSVVGHAMQYYSSTGIQDLSQVHYNYGQGSLYTENMVAGVDNPYKDDYNYADGAYFGQLDSEDLTAIFERILNKVQLNGRYDYLLKKGTNVVITDPIGDDMEVKGEPVLNYFGKNYSVTDRNTVTDGDTTYTDYYWKKEVDRVEDSDAKIDDITVDLSNVVARVSTNTKTGEQVVTLTIPESALPVFYPDLNRNFYYEELPLRLIFRVGLTETAEQSLADSYDDYGYGEGIYYTNKYDGDKACTTVTFYPEDGNPYYENLGDGKSYAKEENTTGTATSNFSEYYNEDNGVVTQLLGNNGKLKVVKNNTIDINVEKQWECQTDKHPDSVDVYLYVKGTKTDENNVTTDFVYCCGNATLSADNNWKTSWQKLRRDEVSGNYKYKYDVYYVTESVPDGYVASYSDALGNEIETEDVPITTKNLELVDDETDATDAKSDDVVVHPMSSRYQWVEKTTYVDGANANSGNVVITNRTSFELPESGGIGDKAMGLGAFASTILVVFLFLKRKRNTEI